MIVPINTSMQEDIRNFFVKHWGSTQMVVSSGTYDCAELEGFVYMKTNQIHGLVTEFPSGKAHSFRDGMKARQDAECQ